MAKITLNVDEVTVGDLEDTEKLLGHPCLGSFSNKSMSATEVAALVTVIQRKTDPTFEIADARSLRIVDITVEGDGHPTSASA